MVILLVFNTSTIIKPMFCGSGCARIIFKSMKSESSTKRFVQVKFVDELATIKKTTSKKVTKSDNFSCLFLTLLHIYVLMTNL